MGRSLDITGFFNGGGGGILPAMLMPLLQLSVSSALSLVETQVAATPYASLNLPPAALGNVPTGMFVPLSPFGSACSNPTFSRR